MPQPTPSFALREPPQSQLVSRPASECGSPVRGVFRGISAGLFGCIILAIFLPFVSVSCSGQDIVDIRAIDLILHRSAIIGDGGALASTEAPVSIMIFGVLTALGVGGGIVTSLLWNRIGTIGAAIAGIWGAVNMGLLKWAIDHEVSGKSGPGGLEDIGRMLLSSELLKVEYRVGYWLMLALFIAAAVVNVVLLLLPPSRSSGG